MKSMHAICHRIDGRPANLIDIEPQSGRYASGWWQLDSAEAKSVIGGWLYLHESSSEISHFAAEIEEVNWRDDGKFCQLLVRRHKGKHDRAWRGAKAGQNPSSYYRIVDHDSA